MIALLAGDSLDNQANSGTRVTWEFSIQSLPHGKTHVGLDVMSIIVIQF
jgi:hypothetical protein